MPQRDSCASALAPRLSPKARGLSKTQAAGVSDASRGGRQQPGRHPYARVCCGVPPARFRRTSPIGFIQPRQPTRQSARRAGLAARGEARRFPNSRQEATMRSGTQRSAVPPFRDLTTSSAGRGGASLDFRQNAKFSCGYMVRAGAPRSGLVDSPPLVSDHPASHVRRGDGCRRVASRSWARPIRGEVPGQQDRRGPAAAADG